MTGFVSALQSPILSSSLAFVPIYLWSRRHPSTPISLFGLFTITAPYLPLALVAFSWLLNGTWRAAAGDLVGCAVGHVGWFDEGCVDKGDDWGTHNIERAARETVSYFSMRIGIQLIRSTVRKRLCGDI